MRYVRVKFLSTKDQTTEQYFYKDVLTKKLQKYDTVLVPTRYGMSIATVTATYKDDNQVNNAITKGYVTIDSIKNVLEKIKSKVIDEEMKLEKVDELKKKLDDKMKQVDDAEKYKMYAKISPEVAELLKELEALKS